MVDNDLRNKRGSPIGLIVAGSFGLAGLVLVAATTPFTLPALRKHCLPYVPATDIQLRNLSIAFKKHTPSNRTNSFIDIGSGDGRICRLAHQTGLFEQVDGVELNSLLVLYSRALAIREGNWAKIKFHRRDLWKFPLNRYDSICLFGVESMMDPLEKYLRETGFKNQIVFTCRFPFKNCNPIDEIGTGIDTVWIYKLENRTSQDLIVDNSISSWKSLQKEGTLRGSDQFVRLAKTTF